MLLAIAKTVSEATLPPEAVQSEAAPAIEPESGVRSVGLPSKDVGDS